MEVQFLYTLNRDRKAPGYSHGFIEAEFTILLDGRTFFSDPYLTIAELGVDLGEWVTDIKRGIRRDMEYISIDHDETILTFSWLGDEKWRISSIWQQFESVQPAATPELLASAKTFLEELNNELNLIRYVIKLDRYI